jgi:Xaa-Pro aminopeptidase
MDAAGLEALAIFYPARIAYLTGFHHVPTERPIVLLLGPEEYWALVVPAVEKEHAESVPGIESVEVYFEYPGDRHPMYRVVEVLRSEGVNPGRVGADHDGVVPHWGYRGPRLSDLLEARPMDAEMLVESLRRIKSGNELACIQLSCDWASRAHRRMQERIRPGLTEMESYQPALVESLSEMIRELPGWRPRGFDGTGLTAMFVGGRSTAMPHGFVQGHGIEAGDVLVSGAGADVDGYRSELERTMVVGQPTAAQAEAFEAMLALQSRAIEQLRPGAPVAEVELEVLRLARELGHEQDLRHHVGHSIGLEGHEAPFLDRGDDAICEEGMVFTVEPGVYVPALGGFRHSDTVCVTSEGSRVMTDYPRRLEDLLIQA